jgi:PilZ domain-containing protein
MRPDPLEVLATPSKNNYPGEAIGGRGERRKRPRVKVHWQVSLIRSDSAEIIETVTQDLSSTGFYCFSQMPFSVGEVLHCMLRIPPYESTARELERALECKLRVVRLELNTADGRLGVGCRIEDFRVAADSLGGRFRSGISEPDRHSGFPDLPPRSISRSAAGNVTR